MKWIAALPIGISSGQAKGLVGCDTRPSVDDAVFGLDSAITDAGPVSDRISHRGEMHAVRLLPDGLARAAIGRD